MSTTTKPTPTVLQTLQALITEKATLVADLATARQRITKLEGELTTAQAGAKPNTEQLAAKDAEIARLNAELDNINTALTTATGQVEKLQGEKKTVAAATTETIAALGVNPDALPKQTTEGAPQTAEELMKEYQSITDPGKSTAFYRQHKAALMSLRNK